jgi:D-alanyl-D-alanine carboxypeptidase (penicillin-binding protein 5/6)
MSKSAAWFNVFVLVSVFLCNDCKGVMEGKAASIVKRGALAAKQQTKKLNFTGQEENASVKKKKKFQHGFSEQNANDVGAFGKGDLSYRRNSLQQKDKNSVHKLDGKNVDVGATGPGVQDVASLPADSSSVMQCTTEAQQAIVVDYDTGEVLYAKQPHEKCIPSSMTKLMTIYLLFEALTSGHIHLEDELPVSERAQQTEGSKSFFEAKKIVKLEDIIRSIIVHSGNDGCVVFAEKLSGDEEAFAAEMNQKAEELGLKDTHFVNSTGLPNPNHYASVSDIAVLTRRLIADFPQFYHYFAEKTFTANGITQENRNTLLGNSLNIDGLKTGFTKSGGYGMAISAQKDGKRLIAVINGCKSNKIRMREANRLLAMGFKEFITLKIADPAVAMGKVDVSVGKKDKVDLFANEAIVVSLPRRHRKSLVIELNVPGPIPAPIAAGTKLGEFTYRYGNFTSAKYNLFAHEFIEKLNFLERVVLFTKNLFSVEKSASQLAPPPIGLKLPHSNGGNTEKSLPPLPQHNQAIAK